MINNHYQANQKWSLFIHFKELAALRSGSLANEPSLIQRSGTTALPHILLDEG